MIHTIAATWRDCLRDVHAHFKREPRHLHPSSDCRLDLVMFDSASGANAELEIALAHPWSSDTFPKSAEIDGAAAKRQEERKNSRYKKERLPGGMSVSLIPQLLEHYRRWGEEAWKFLQKLAEQSSDEFGQPNPREFLDFWRKRFAIQLQRCNASVIRRKALALCATEEFKLDSSSTQFFSH
ncbi:uncharacterized protein LOC134183980 [Corticium candelabrum]|uniref:uncharacterized protein LOC134183980 n=1 Tax=Corticium candelabrum TaxID=121492 RepID=UPI002E316C4A|nr:uncharacterized protein LOC134183980 [Corticium candelabrum]